MSDVRTDQARVWLIDNRAGPANVPSYKATLKAGSPEMPRGEPKVVRKADPANYGRFLVVDKIPGETGSPSVTLSGAYKFGLSKLLEVANRGCDVDVQIHMGKCSNPQDFNKGWEKILVIEAVAPAGWKLAGDLNVQDEKDRDFAQQELKLTGENIFEIAQMKFAEQAGTAIVQEVIAVVICDSIQCGSCGVPSNGCQKVFAVTKSHGGSPGLPAEVIYTDDQGGSWADTVIDTLGAAEDPSDAACVGEYLAVITNEGNALHYAELADILNAAETWTKVTGFNASGEPNAIYAVDPMRVFVVGDGGYIYKLTDITAAVTASNVQDAGVATTEDLKDVHAYDENNVLAVGDNNAVVYTIDGGLTWSLVTGPDVAVNLTCCWMKSVSEWFVGTAGGKLWYTRDSGTSWTEKSFPGSGAGSVKAVKFSNDTVGYMSHATATTRGRMLKTLDGGQSWYVLPDANFTMPLNDGLNDLAVCSYDPNIVFGGGLADNATDGFLVKGSAAAAE